MSDYDSDLVFMEAALRLARRAAARGEVPVGAIVVRDGEVISRGANATLSTGDPTGHAEIVALRRAAGALQNHRLTGCVLFVTLEPCLMCLGAMIQARLARCVFGASDPRVGASTVIQDPRVRRGLNHRLPLEGGVRSEECARLLRQFFRARRGNP